jgi:hypothetical protein
MDYTHSPYLFWLVAIAGVLFGVLVMAMALMMFRKPRGTGGGSAPPPRRGSGPGDSGHDGGDLG